MNNAERAYRAAQAKEKRLLGEDAHQPEPESQKKGKPHPVDYDPDEVPLGYVMPHVARFSANLIVGPPCVTKCHTRYLKEHLGDPHVVQLKLPPAKERSLWKEKEAIAWYAAYAKTLLKEQWEPQVVHAKRALYLCHENGCDEEVMVALVLWALAEPESATVPRTADHFLSWRADHEYGWLLDRDEDAKMAIVAGCSVELAANAAAAKRNSVMTQWLMMKRSK